MFRKNSGNEFEHRKRIGLYENKRNKLKRIPDVSQDPTVLATLILFMLNISQGYAASSEKSVGFQPVTHFPNVSTPTRFRNETSMSSATHLQPQVSYREAVSKHTPSTYTKVADAILPKSSPFKKNKPKKSQKLNVEVNQVTPANGYTTLHFAAMINGHSSIEKYIRKGMSPNVYTPAGETPLFFAVTMGHKESVMALLHGGAKIKEKDRSGKTVLEHAQMLAKTTGDPRYVDIVDILSTTQSSIYVLPVFFSSLILAIPLCWLRCKKDKTQQKKWLVLKDKIEEGVRTQFGIQVNLCVSDQGLTLDVNNPSIFSCDYHGVSVNIPVSYLAKRIIKIKESEQCFKLFAELRQFLDNAQHYQTTKHYQPTLCFSDTQPAPHKKQILPPEVEPEVSSYERNESISAKKIKFNHVHQVLQKKQEEKLKRKQEKEIPKQTVKKKPIREVSKVIPEISAKRPSFPCPQVKVNLSKIRICEKVAFDYVETLGCLRALKEESVSEDKSEDCIKQEKQSLALLYYIHRTDLALLVRENLLHPGSSDAAMLRHLRTLVMHTLSRAYQAAKETAQELQVFYQSKFLSMRKCKSYNALADLWGFSKNGCYFEASHHGVALLEETTLGKMLEKHNTEKTTNDLFVSTAALSLRQQLEMDDLIFETWVVERIISIINLFWLKDVPTRFQHQPKILFASTEKADVFSQRMSLNSAEDIPAAKIILCMIGELYHPQRKIRFDVKYHFNAVKQKLLKFLNQCHYVYRIEAHRILELEEIAPAHLQKVIDVYGDEYVVNTCGLAAEYSQVKADPHTINFSLLNSATLQNVGSVMSTSAGI